jgi:hypothetical protein
MLDRGPNARYFCGGYRLGTEMFFYAVRHGGKYFHRVGYSGGGQSWVDGLDAATIYPKRSQAVARVTWWARNGRITPELVRLAVTVDGVETLTEHVAKALQRPTAAERREVAHKRRDYERAKAAYDAVR